MEGRIEIVTKGKQKGGGMEERTKRMNKVWKEGGGSEGR